MSFGEMLPDEAPPVEIWLDDEELDAHFTRLREKRREAHGGDDDTEGEENAAALALLRSIGAA